MQSNLFNTDFFVANRKKLASVVKADLLVISANAQVQSSADMTFKFRQDSHFWYLIGLEVPEAVLVMDLRSGKDMVLIPEPNSYAKVFDGHTGLELAKEISGVDEVHWYDEGWKIFTRLMRKAKKVGMTLPHEPYIETYAMYANPARENLMQNVRRDFTMTEYIDIRMDIARLRMIKQPQEIEALQRAIDITAAAFNDLTLGKYKTEYEVEAAISFGFRRRGASGHGYDPIVACGKNACTLHYNKNEGDLYEANQLLIDAGAVYQGYTADITRVFSIGEPTARLVAVTDSVRRAARRCAKALKPGLMMRDYMLTCDQFVGEELIKLGLISQNTRDQIRTYYPHSTSHFLGLDAHDAGDYEMPLQPNTVLTIEPGIYIPQEGIGVRIEDNYLITETGCKNLSAALSSELKILQLKK